MTPLKVIHKYKLANNSEFLQILLYEFVQKICMLKVGPLDVLGHLPKFWTNL